MSITCKFKLSRSPNTYYCGEEIVGSVTICCIKPFLLQDIKLEFHGQSTVQWWESDQNNESVTHNDFSVYEVANKTLRNSQRIHISEHLKLNSANCQQLLPHVEYPFKFCYLISREIPATFSCQYGQTEYALRLQIQLKKKADREYCHRIVIKRTLDLTQRISYAKACAVYHSNKFGQISLQVPCNGFTPGQIIPYQIRYQTAKNACKTLMQLNCYVTCRMPGCCYKFKQVKQVVNYKKSLTNEVSSHLTVPLPTHISTTNDSGQIFSIRYALEAFVFDGKKKVLLATSLPLTIGSTPCCKFQELWNDYMCFDNFGSSFNELTSHQSILRFDCSANDRHEHHNHLSKSLSQAYSKLMKSF